jgi:hypothetical protein
MAQLVLSQARARMTLEEQFHNVAHLLKQTAQLALRNDETCKRLFEVAEVQSRSLGTLTETVTIPGNKLITLTEAHNRLTEEIAGS